MPDKQRIRSKKFYLVTQFLALIVIPVATVWIAKIYERNVELRREEVLRKNLAVQEKLAQAKLALDLLPHLAAGTQQDLARAVLESAVPGFAPRTSREPEHPLSSRKHKKRLSAAPPAAGQKAEFREHLKQGNVFFRLGLFASADREYLIATQSLPHDAITLVDSHLLESARADYDKGLFPDAARQFESAFHRVPVHQ